MAERTPNFAFSIKSLKDKKFIALKQNMKLLQQAISPISGKLDSWGTTFSDEFEIRKVTAIPRMGKDNPNLQHYKKKVTTKRHKSFWSGSGSWTETRIQVEARGKVIYKTKSNFSVAKEKKRKISAMIKPLPGDESHFDVYVRGTPIMAGYIPNPNQRDVALKTDQEGRAHAEKGPAFAACGFAFYYWHGTQVPPYFITDKKQLTAEKIFSFQNAETRRAATEIVGWDNLIESLNPVVLDAHENPEVGTLIEVQLKIPGRGTLPQKLLRVQCGTGRKFAIPVENNCWTAMEAQAFIWDKPKNGFKMPEVRT